MESNLKKPTRRKWSLVIAAAALCLLCWLAMGTGLALGVGFTPRLILVTAAAVSTEVVIWLFAATMGLSAFQARRQLWRKLGEALRKALDR